LKSAVEETVISSEPIAYHREEEISRGRCEIRETYLYAREDNLDKGWESINLIVYMRREFLSKDKEHQTDSFYVSDLQTTDAKQIAKGIRSHWHIENKFHYVKDVIMREDALCTKNKKAAANLAMFRNFAYNILKEKNKSIKQATEIFASYNVKKLLYILLRT